MASAEDQNKLKLYGSALGPDWSFNLAMKGSTKEVNNPQKKNSYDFFLINKSNLLQIFYNINTVSSSLHRIQL